jgi:pimeloyl-ACP methyl ester carboxylesterase
MNPAELDGALMMKFVLVHSPLVGPTTWRWIANALSTAGHETIVPDLRDAAVAGRPDAVISTAVAATPQEWTEVVVVGHSGAGSILPSIAAESGHRAVRMVFVDAGLPPCEGRVTSSADFLDQLRALAVDGVLPRWSTWWGDGVMEALVPDHQRRTELEAEMIEVPLAYFESAFDVPVGWCDSAASFLLLSEAYRDDAERARTMGWRTIERIGNHLDIVNDADAIANTIIELAT